MKKLWKTVSLKDLDNAYMKLEDHEKKQFAAEAKALREMKLWKWLHEEMLRAVSEQFFIKGTNENDYIAAKLCLWMEDVRNRKVDNIAKHK